MDSLEYDHNLFQNNKGDESLYVNFYMSFLQNEVKSATEGRAIFDDVEFVKIFSPGDRTNIIDRPVRPSDKVRFAKQYAAFKNNQTIQASGTPLAEWPIVTRSMAEELKYLGFQTVEQIAEANDNNIGKHMGLRDLQNKARAYLEVAKGNTKPIEEMTARLNEMSTQVRMRDDAIEVMRKELDAVKAAQGKAAK